MTRVGAELGLARLGWDEHFPGVHATGRLGQGDDDAAVAFARCGSDSWVADLWCANEFVEGHLVRLGDR